MSLKVMNDNNINILSKEDANHYYTLSGYTKHFISDSYGDKFAVTVTGLLAKLGTGQGTIYGRHIINNGETEISCQLPINSMGYLVLHLDLTKPAGSEVTFTTKLILDEEDLVNKGTNYDMPLYMYTTSASMVTQLVDIREYFDFEISTDKIVDKAVTADKIDTSVLLKIYPVGSIYISVNNINPSTLFGGTWSAFGSGKTIVGVDTTQSEFSTVQKTGGEKTHTLTVDEMPSHGHSSNTTGAHIHSLGGWVHATGSGYGHAVGGTAHVFGNQTTFVSSAGGHSHTISNQGGNGEHNNLQPYITVYMWRRIS